VVLRAAQRLHALAVLGRARIDVLRDRRRADERDGADEGSSRIASTASLSPWTTFRMPAGSPASANASAIQTPPRVALAGLEDDGVAGGDGGRHHPQRHHRREVERRDARDDADRLTHLVHVDAGGDLLGVLALEVVHEARAELDVLEPRATSPRASGTVLPCSAVMMRASSSAREATISRRRNITC
jgi:hypothetical protein